MRDDTIWDVLNRELFFVKDAVKRSDPKLADKLDVYDPVQRVVTMEVREPQIGPLTKAARFCGGDHDRGAAFDLVAKFPNSEQQAVRVSGRSPFFGLNNRRVEIADHRGILVATLKKLALALGLKFEFTEVATNEKSILELRQSALGGQVDLFLDGNKIAAMKRHWDGSHDDFFKTEKFGYAFWISPEVKKNSPLRQTLVAFGLAHHRVVI